MIRLTKFKLSHQLLFVITILAIFIFTLIYSLSQFFVHQFTKDLNKETVDGIYKDAQTFLLSESQRIGNLSISHAYWTDLLEAAHRFDRTWIEENASLYLAEENTYNIDFYYLKSDSGYLDIYGYLPYKLIEEIAEGISDENLLSGPTPYLVQYNNELILLSFCALSDTEAKQVDGIYMLGSRLDDTLGENLLSRYQDTLSFDVQLKSKIPVKIYPIREPSSLELIHELFDIALVQYNLTESINNNADKLLMVILLILFMAAIIVIAFLMKISANLELSIDRIKGITYNDYSKKINLEFSKDFAELSDCINELSTKLEIRDESIYKRYIELITTLLKTLEEVDIYTKGHSERVSHYAVALAASMEYESLESIRIAGLLHDVGKITIPARILNKPGRLNPEEFDEIKNHPRTAFNILSASDEFKEVKHLVLHHHERYDGSGYPDGLSGDAIPIGSMIIALADVFDSLTSRRSYREPLTCDDALALMKKDIGSHFDPALFDIFLSIAPRAYTHFSGLNKLPTEDEFL